MMPKGKDVDERTKLTLESDDCALVMRADGTTECYLPHPEEEDHFVGIHSIICAAVSIKVQDRSFVEEMINFMEKEQMGDEGKWVH